MHVEIETMEWVSILMEKCMEPNYMQGGFDLRFSGGQDSTFNEPHDGQAQALTLALGIFSHHLFGPQFNVEGGSCFIVGAAHTLVGIVALVTKLLQV